MTIKKFEQSGFIIETNNGFKLAIDIGSHTPPEKLGGISVDAILVSHIHPDHFSIDQIKALAPKKLYLNRECIETLKKGNLDSKIVEVKTGDVINIDDIKVTFFDVDHGPNVRIRPKENFGFLVEVDEKKIYFAGDMFYPSGIDVTNLEVNRALIPIGGHYTFNPEDALAFVSQFKHIGNVTPMHYEKNPEKREEFIKLAVEKGYNTESLPIR
jgi:L-ascorbate metabolism protein UlaG (beta-lactamase superfamily)